MSDLILETSRLRLILETPEAVLARIEAMDPADRAEVSPEWLARARAATEPDPWVHGFAIQERATGTPVGGGAFKGTPSAEGVVEIAYMIEPSHQSRGYATEAAKALVEFAFSRGVRTVLAHTKPDHGATQRVLAKAGFACLGETVDPEDGVVLRFEIRLN